jgi:hypothetical protein
MIYDQKSGALYGDDGEFLKALHCPLALHFAQLNEVRGSADRHCPFCSSDVLNIDDVSDEQLKEELVENPELCVFSTPAATGLTILGRDGFAAENQDDLPVVRTARGTEAMENAFRNGHQLVLKQVRPAEDEGGPEKYQLWQNPETSEVLAIGDYRSVPSDPGFELVAEWFWHDPNLPFPFAAYLVPRELAIGARVFLDDLIEGRWIETWNQGNGTRQLSGPATWNGSDFDLEQVESPFECVVG